MQTLHCTKRMPRRRHRHLWALRATCSQQAIKAWPQPRWKTELWHGFGIGLRKSSECQKKRSPNHESARVLSRPGLEVHFNSEMLLLSSCPGNLNTAWPSVVIKVIISFWSQKSSDPCTTQHRWTSVTEIDHKYCSSCNKAYNISECFSTFVCLF